MFKIKFLRRVVLSSLALVIILPLYNIFVIYPSFTKAIAEDTENEAIRTATQLISAFITEKAALGIDYYSVDPKKIEDLRKNFNLIKIKVFSPSGKTIYSTDPEDIGKINTNKYFREIVSEGKKYSNIVKKNTKSLEGETATADMVETYVPITKGDLFLGAFKVYYDISAKKEKYDRIIFHSSALLIFIAFSLVSLVIITSSKAKQNISEREKTEIVLREREEQYRLFLNNFHGIAFKLNIDYTPVFFHGNVEQITGYTEKDFLDGKPRWDQIIFREDVHKKLYIQGEKMRSIPGYSEELEYRIVMKDGTIKWVHDITNNTGNDAGKPVYVQGVIYDITASREAKEALQVSEKRFTDISTNAQEWIWEMDIKGKYTYSNPGIKDILGYEPWEMLNKYIYDLYSSEERRELQDKIFNVLFKKQSFRGFITKNLNKNGDIVWLTTSGVSMLDDKGNVIGYRGASTDITETKRAEVTIQRQLNRLNALHSIDRAITSSIDLRVTLGILLDQATKEMGIDAASILLLNQHSQMLEYAVNKGFRSSALKYTTLKLGESNAGRAALSRQIIIIPDLREKPDGFAKSKLLKEEDFVTYFAVPLIAKGQVKGVLELFNRFTMGAEPEWLDFLETVADQAAIAIDNATLFDELQRSNLELTLSYDRTIEGWSRATDMRDKETEGHTQRVAEMTVHLAKKLGVKEEELIHIRRGALLHDIGKIGIPDKILLKPGALTEKEWDTMKYHPEFAYELLRPIEYLRPALSIPYYHHERWDGKGYPKGLKGEEIPFAARIFSIVDVWDALSSDRPYRPAWSRDKVIEHLRSNAGFQFDPKVVEAFLTTLDWKNS